MTIIFKKSIYSLFVLGILGIKADTYAADSQNPTYCYRLYGGNTDKDNCQQNCELNDNYFTKIILNDPKCKNKSSPVGCYCHKYTPPAQAQQNFWQRFSN